MKNIQLTLLALLIVTVASAQNFNGFALYNAQGSNTTYLIDENQNIAHKWDMSSECNYTVAYAYFQQGRYKLMMVDPKYGGAQE